MKKFFLLLIPVFAIAIVMYASEPEMNSADNGIAFYGGSWKEVLQKAESENKLIFLDIYASWCGPCKMLKKRTFPNSDVGAYFNANFINVSFDGEKGDGIMLAEKYRITGYPTLLILDTKGNVINGTSGYMPADDLLKFGQEANHKKD